VVISFISLTGLFLFLPQKLPCSHYRGISFFFLYDWACYLSPFMVLNISTAQTGIG